METTKRLATLLLIGATALCGPGARAGAVDAGDVGHAGTDPVAEGETGGSEIGSLVPDDGYHCDCIDTYADGHEAVAPRCDSLGDRCTDMAVLLDCEDDPSGPECGEQILRCECDCVSEERISIFEPDPDVMLTGIPDLWQFAFMCGDSHGIANSVGCGPIAAAMVFYWWAQRGYEALVADALWGPGRTVRNRQHDWFELVETLRAEYLDGGICVPFEGGLYATPPWTLADGLREYAAHAGYQANVAHWKTCSDCAAAGPDEIAPDAALDLIRGELEEGRPVILGFNAGTALESPIQVLEDGRNEWVYTGPLSNGTPVTGTISHYAVITGYRKLGNLDALSLNLGASGGTTDHLVAWNPAGKWLHLFTMGMSPPDDDLGLTWCSIDRGYDVDHSPPLATAFHPDNIELSHERFTTPSPELQLTPLAGASCGIARPGRTTNRFDRIHTEARCATVDDLVDKTGDILGGGDFADPGEDRAAPDVGVGDLDVEREDILP